MEENTLFTSRPDLSSVSVLGDLGCEKQQVLMKHSLSWAAQEFATTLGFWIWNLFNLQQLGFADLGAVDGIGGVHFCLEPFVSDLACALLLCFFACALLVSSNMIFIMLVILLLSCHNFLEEVVLLEEMLRALMRECVTPRHNFWIPALMVGFADWLKQVTPESEVPLAMLKNTTSICAQAIFVNSSHRSALIEHLKTTSKCVKWPTGIIA